MSAVSYSYVQVLGQEIDRCRPWIEAALNRSIRSHRFEDVKQLILHGEAQIWSTENGCCVTTITVYPISKALQIWLLGGDFEEVYNAHNDAIESFAKAEGCDQLVVNGRRGWERRLKSRGYEFSAVILNKEI
jgi:hypothetical protein